MRKLALAGALAGLLATGVTPAGSEERMMAGEAWFAIADWAVPRPNSKLYDGYLVFASFYQDHVPAGTRGEAWIVRGTCRLRTRGNTTTMSCRGEDQVFTQLDEGAFVVDPALRSARLRVRSNRVTHRVRWTGVGLPHPVQVSHGWASGDGSSGWDETYGLGRDATARGRVFRNRIRTGDELDWFWIARGANIGSVEDGSMRVVAEDEGHRTVLTWRMAPV